MTTIQTGEVEVCIPVSNEIGTPPDIALMVDPDFNQEMKEVADRVESTHTWQTNELDNGEAAQRAITTLGCDACKLSEVCVVRSTLGDKVEAGKENGDLQESLTMLASAPRWLAAARLGKTNTDTAELRSIISDTERTKTALADGTLDTQKLLAGIENHPEGLMGKANLPELAGIDSIDANTQFEAQRIETENGNQFIVIDASAAVGFKEKPLTSGEYGVLATKFLDRLTELDQTGQPQILNPDNTQQKVVRNTTVGHIDEVRRGGKKDRLYVSIAPASEAVGETTRLVILGDHGGDYSTQDAFFKLMPPGR